MTIIVLVLGMAAVFGLTAYIIWKEIEEEITDTVGDNQGFKNIVKSPDGFCVKYASQNDKEHDKRLNEVLAELDDLIEEWK